MVKDEFLTSNFGDSKQNVLLPCETFITEAKIWQEERKVPLRVSHSLKVSSAFQRYFPFDKEFRLIT